MKALMVQKPIHLATWHFTWLFHCSCSKSGSYSKAAPSSYNSLCSHYESKTDQPLHALIILGYNLDGGNVQTQIVLATQQFTLHFMAAQTVGTDQNSTILIRFNYEKEESIMRTKQISDLIIERCNLDNILQTLIIESIFIRF